MTLRLSTLLANGTDLLSKDVVLSATVGWISEAPSTATIDSDKLNLTLLVTLGIDAE